MEIRYGDYVEPDAKFQNTETQSHRVTESQSYTEDKKLFYPSLCISVTLCLWGE